MAISFSKALRNFLLHGGSLKRSLQGSVMLVYSGTVPADADASIGAASLLYTLCDIAGARGGDTPATGTATFTGYGGSLSTLTVNGVSVIVGSVSSTGKDVSALASAVAASINTKASLPDYTGSLGGAGIAAIRALVGTGTGPNGFVVTGTIAQATTLGVMAGGVTTAAEVRATATLTIAGTGVSATPNNVDFGLGTSTFAPSGTTTNMATQIKDAVNSVTVFYGYTATSSTNHVTVTAPVGSGASANGATLSCRYSEPAFTYTPYPWALFSGGVTAATEVKSSFAFDLNGAGAGGMTSILTFTVNGVSVVNAAVPYNTTDAQTASDLAASINTKVSAPDYTAVAVGTTVTISAAAGTGAGPNGFAVVATFNPVLAVGFGNMAGGTAANPINYTLETRATGTMTLTGGAAGSIDNVTVGGVSIIDAPVPFNSSLTQTAADLVVAINRNLSSPDYTASSSGAVVTITAVPGAGAVLNGSVVTATLTTITATFANMSGGVAAVNALRFGIPAAATLHKAPSQIWYGSPAAGASNVATFFRLITVAADVGQSDTAETLIRVQGTVGDGSSSSDCKLLLNSYVKEDSVLVTDFQLSL